MNGRVLASSRTGSTSEVTRGHRTSFDRRIVRYEEIHSIDAEDFRTFVAAAEISSGCQVLDCGCGYGAFTREVLSTVRPIASQGVCNLKIDLLDESLIQLNRAREELRPWRGVPGIELNFIEGAFPDGLGQFSKRYDAAGCKMVLHEIRPGSQLSFLENAYECLKPGGRLVMWDVCLSEEIAGFYRAVIRSKDALAGYESMVERRHFLTEEELRRLFAASPFREAAWLKNISYRFDTRRRLEPEFQDNDRQFAQWQAFIRSSAAELDSAVLAKLNYVDKGETICFNVRKVILAARRPIS